MSKRRNEMSALKDLLADVMPADIPVAPPAAKEPLPAKRTSKRMERRVDGVMRVRAQREADNQRVGYLARPFILCGLPFKKPKKGVSYYRRENGDEVLEITASPEYGLPFGMDIEVLIWVSTLAAHARKKNGGKIPRVLEFASGKDFLNAFNLPLDGRTYRRAQERFLRVFYATWFWGPKHKSRAKLFRIHFFDHIDLWFTKDLDTPSLPGEDFKNNSIVLSEAFANDLELHLPPIDLDAIATWSDKPTTAYTYMWLGWRCYTARGRTEIPLMGPTGVKQQCGFEGYEGPRGPRRFRQKMQEILAEIKIAWPTCPVQLVIDETHTRGDYLLIERRALAIREAPRLGS
jgi:hypothetical protein